MTKTYIKGFTLIELLVVISIIGVLTAVILPNMVGMRERARDSQKKSALNELRTALRLYYNDFQQYPINSGDTMMGCVDGTSACSPGGEFASGSTIYMKELPSDFAYLQTDGGNGFRLSTVLDNKSDADVDSGSSVGESGQRCGVTTAGAAGTYYTCSN